MDLIKDVICPCCFRKEDKFPEANCELHAAAPALLKYVKARIKERSKADDQLLTELMDLGLGEIVIEKEKPDQVRCSCGALATTTYTMAFARHAYPVQACRTCADKVCTMVDTENRKLTDICKDLNDLLKKEFGEEMDETFSVSRDKRDATWPIHWRWISVFAVTGGSEGHYIHVDIYPGSYVIDHKGQTVGGTIQMLMMKTFMGSNVAGRIAARAAQLLGA